VQVGTKQRKWADGVADAVDLGAGDARGVVTSAVIASPVRLACFLGLLQSVSSSSERALRFPEILLGKHTVMGAMGNDEAAALRGDRSKPDVDDKAGEAEREDDAPSEGNRKLSYDDLDESEWMEERASSSLLAGRVKSMLFQINWIASSSSINGSSSSELEKSSQSSSASTVSSTW